MRGRQMVFVLFSAVGALGEPGADASDGTITNRKTMRKSLRTRKRIRSRRGSRTSKRRMSGMEGGEDDYWGRRMRRRRRRRRIMRRRMRSRKNVDHKSLLGCLLGVCWRLLGAPLEARWLEP